MTLRRAAARWAVRVAVVAVLGVVLLRVGAAPFVQGLRGVTGIAVVLALGLTAAATVLSAWRWTLVSRGARRATAAADGRLVLLPLAAPQQRAAGWRHRRCRARPAVGAGLRAEAGRDPGRGVGPRRRADGAAGAARRGAARIRRSSSRRGRAPGAAAGRGRGRVAAPPGSRPGGAERPDHPCSGSGPGRPRADRGTSWHPRRGRGGIGARHAAARVRVRARGEHHGGVARRRADAAARPRRAGRDDDPGRPRRPRPEGGDGRAAVRSSRHRGPPRRHGGDHLRRPGVDRGAARSDPARSGPWTARHGRTRPASKVPR